MDLKRFLIIAMSLLISGCASGGGDIEPGDGAPIGVISESELPPDSDVLPGASSGRVAGVPAHSRDGTVSISVLEGQDGKSPEPHAEFEPPVIVPELPRPDELKPAKLEPAKLKPAKLAPAKIIKPKHTKVNSKKLRTAKVSRRSLGTSKLRNRQLEAEKLKGAELPSKDLSH